MYDTIDNAATKAHESAIAWQAPCYVYQVSEGLRSRYMLSLNHKPGWVYRARHD